MIPSWSSASTLILRPLPVGQVRVHTTGEGILPARLFSHNGSAALTRGNTYYSPVDVNYWARLQGGRILYGVYLNIRIVPSCGGT